MVAGELVTEGTPTGIKSAQSGHLLEFISRSTAARDGDLLKSDNERWRVSLFGERLHIITEDDAVTAEQKYREELEGKRRACDQCAGGAFLARRRFLLQRCRESAAGEGKVAVEE